MSSLYNWDESSSLSIETSMRVEVDKSIFVVPFDSFHQTLLYPPTSGSTSSTSSPSRYPSQPATRSAALRSGDHLDRDRATAERCLKALRTQPVGKSAKVPRYGKDGFSQVRSWDQRQEKGLYKPLVALMEFIGDFYRKERGDVVDEAWPAPSMPLRSSSRRKSASRPLPRQRHFFDTHTQSPRFSRPATKSPGVKPDISLMLVAGDNTSAPHWKDIRVAIEVKQGKSKDSFADDLSLQVASYTRAMKLEQFDRKFFYTVSISSASFRVWRWDPSCAYVSEAVDYHKDPLSLIQLIQRLVSLDPAGLGYDTQFSNAGTAVASDDVPLILTVTSSTTKPHPSSNPIITAPSSTPTGGPSTISPEANPENELRPLDGEKRQTIEVELDRDMLCETRDLLFCRSTRAWKSVPRKGSDNPTLYAVKQNWQDDLRTPEPDFHQTAEGIEGILELVAYEVLDSTREAYDRVAATITGWYEFDWEHDAGEGRRKTPAFRAKTKDNSLPSVCHRLLCRLLFIGVGRPLWEVETPLHLLLVLQSILKSVLALHAIGLLHRDISIGNILISDKPPEPGMLIDLGLCQHIPTEEELAAAEAEGIYPQTHHHLTGTLPYVAHDILLANTRDNVSVKHDLQHDLESLFWVAFYLCLKIAILERLAALDAGRLSSGDLSAPRVDVRWAKEHLAGLESPNIATVRIQKQTILSTPEMELFGRFAPLGPFLLKFREYCYKSMIKGGNTPLTGKQVSDLFEEAITYLKTPPPPPPAVVATPPGSPKRPREESEYDEDGGSPRTIRRTAGPKTPRTPLATSGWSRPPSC